MVRSKHSLSSPLSQSAGSSSRTCGVILSLISLPFSSPQAQPELPFNPLGSKQGCPIPFLSLGWNCCPGGTLPSSAWPPASHPQLCLSAALGPSSFSLRPAPHLQHSVGSLLVFLSLRLLFARLSLQSTPFMSCHPSFSSSELRPSHLERLFPLSTLRCLVHLHIPVTQSPSP